ncbi:phosphotransferase [Nocardiopsis flavescens]|uniref:phosphotransferase n=1 Tax=Nocardiopsis flavescens TaxID=758803 RepID=UPI0036469B1D
MRESERRRAIAAATAIAASLGLAADDAVVLHDSNKLALRLLPCDVMARVGPVGHGVARFEVDIAHRLAAAGAPVAALDPRSGPRVHERDGFEVTLWTHYTAPASGHPGPADHADALLRLHAGMRGLDVPMPHFADRIGEAQRLVADRDRTPALADADRQLLADTLRSQRRTILEHGAPEQALHGEPHPGNVLDTDRGPLFIDFETCCRGPVEFDLAHAPAEVAAHYPGADPALLRACGLLVLALVTAWRWDRDDLFPDGLRMGTEWLGRIRAVRDTGADPNVRV